MMRSLFAGVSGLKNHQTRMDVIGNNIANVNTVGFKSGRVNFKELLALTIRGATRPTEARGGTNPLQVGLGMNIATIDTLFSQGNLESTGRKTDMAIDGEGFFVLRNGKANYFSRAGAFSFDANGRLSDAASGWIVQGKLADNTGAIPSSSTVQDVVLPFGQKVPAKATTSITFSGNLDAGAAPLPTITDSGPVLAVEKAGDDSDLDGLYARGQANSFISGVISGVTTLTVNDGTKEMTYSYVNNDGSVGNSQFHSLDDLIAEMNKDYTSFSATLDANGAVVITDLSGAAHTMKFTSNNPTLQTAFSAANGTVDSSVSLTTKSDEFSHYATGSELVVNLRNSNGSSLGIVDGDTINLDAEVGGNAVSSTLTVAAATTTYSELVTALNSTLMINSLPGATIDSDGSIHVQGDPGLDNEISSLSLRIPSNSAFNTTLSFGEQQKAKDITHVASITAFDALGEEHVITLTFTKASIANQWTWEAGTGGSEIIPNGNTGKITFNADGSLNAFTFDNGLTALSIDPNNGAEVMNIQLKTGELGTFDGITQFGSPSTAVASNQNGYGNGDLDDILIDRTGKITGLFSNGVTQTLAQIILASFNNPGGLSRVGNNSYAVTGNSGIPIYGQAGDVFQSEIVPGTLEMSNVDLAQEFTNMIIAQRGFQANSRVITTSDEMLTELVNLKR